MIRAPFSRPDGVSNSGEISVMCSTPKSFAKNTAISIGRGRLAFGDEEPDRRFLVDVLHDLRRQRELTDRRRRFEIERREIDGLARAVLDHVDDAGQRLALGQVASPGFMHVSAERVVKLERIDPQMDVRHAETGRLDKAGERSRRTLHLGGFDGVDKRIKQRLQRLDRQQIVAIRLGDHVGCFREAFSIVREALERLELFIDGGDAEIKLADDLASDTLGGVAAFKLVLQDDKALANVRQARTLFAEPDLE